MWKLMRADFRCNPIGFMFLYGVFFIFALINSILGNWEKPLAMVMLALVWAAIILGSSVEIKTKKIRFMAALPVSVRAMGMYRVGSFACWWLCMLLMLLLSTLISRHGRIGLDYVSWLLTITGSIFMLIGFGTLSGDLYFCVKDRKWGRRMMIWIGYPLLLFMLLGASNGLYILANAGTHFYHDFLIRISKALLTLPWAIALFLFGCGLLALTVFAYERRMSYTESSAWPQN